MATDKESNKPQKEKGYPIRKNPFLVAFDFYAPLLEVLIWLIFALIVVYYGVLSSKYGVGFGLETGQSLYYNYNNIGISVIIALIPILTRLIFGEFPFKLLGNLLKKFDSNQKSIEQVHHVNKMEIKVEPENRKEIDVDNTKKNLLKNQIDESGRISEKIYSRSGVYLFVGCLIAFIGVFIFYSPFFNIQDSQSKDTLDRLIDFLPRIAALFFVEFVAFFFLKQYRMMMEEYRYYEAIKRKKQSNYLIVYLVENYVEKPDMLKQILENCSFNEFNHRLEKDESTEILESHKITNQEFNLIEKMVDLIKEIRR